MDFEEENDSSNSASSRSINNIPTEVIDEILFFMDARTLCRLRCTSRWWNVRISSPSFCLLHYSRSLHRDWPLLQVCMKQREYVFSSTDLSRPWHRNLWMFDLPERSFMEVDESSAFGLLNLQISTRLCIYNPTTRSMVVDLPPCNDAVWSPSLALGRMNSTNQFKVVCLCLLQGPASKQHNSDYLKCRVLTIPDDLSNGWREAPIPPSGNSLKLVVSSVESAVYTSNFDKQHLFRFDLKTERWSEVELPLSVKSFSIFMEFRGSPCLVVEKANLRDEIWLLRDGNAWEKKWVLNKSPCMTLFTPLHHDEERGRILIKNCYGAFKWYRIDTKVYEELHDFQVELVRRSAKCSIPFVETLVSLTTLSDINIVGH